MACDDPRASDIIQHPNVFCFLPVLFSRSSLSIPTLRHPPPWCSNLPTMSLCSLLRPDVSCALIRVLRPPACPGASPPFPLSILYTLRCTYLRSPEEVRVMILQQDPTRPGPMADEILPPLRASPRLKIYSLCVPTFVPKLSFPNFSPNFFLNFLPNLCP